MSALLGAVVFALALVGAHTVTRRVCTAVSRTFRGATEWIATKWRAYAFSRERRAAHRRDGVAHLQAETAHTLALALQEARQEIAALRGARAGAVTSGDAIYPGQGN